MCFKDGRTEEATNYSTTTAICSAFLCIFPGISRPSLPQNSKAISLSPKSEQAKKTPQKMGLNPQEQLRTARTTWQNEGRREVEISSILVHPSFAAAAAVGLYYEKSWLWHWGGMAFCVSSSKGRKGGRRRKREYY